MEVIKRDGRRVSYNGDKIALAIRKGFNGVINNNGYTEEDHNKVFSKRTMMKIQQLVLKIFKI